VRGGARPVIWPPGPADLRKSGVLSGRRSRTPPWGAGGVRDAEQGPHIVETCGSWTTSSSGCRPTRARSVRCSGASAVEQGEDHGQGMRKGPAIFEGAEMDKKKREMLKRIKSSSTYRITRGRVPPQGHRPGDLRVRVRSETEGEGVAGRRVRWMAEEQTSSTRPTTHSMLLVFRRWTRQEGRHDMPRHVGGEPAGVQVYSFKQPSMEELDHDYIVALQRCSRSGRIGFQPVVLRGGCSWSGCTGAARAQKMRGTW